MKRKVIAAALASVCWISVGVQAATQAQIDAAWNKGVAWLMTNQHGDGGWSSTLIDGISSRQGLGLQTTAAAIEALANVNIKSGYTYMGGVAWLSNAEPAGVEALARQIQALRTSGEDVSALAAKLQSWQNDRKGWGAYRSYEASLPDTGLGVATLIDALGTGYVNNDIFAALCQILPAQKPTPNFLFPYYVSAPTSATPPPSILAGGAIAPTVHAVLALSKANTRFPGGTCGNGVAYTFTTVMANAVSGLVAKKNADNGFSDVAGTSTVLETALVLRALKTAAPTNTAAPTAIDYLIAQQAVDGSWRADALQTAEVLLALAWPTTAATQRPATTVATDTDGDGIPNGVETVMGRNPSVADSRFLADGAGSVITLAAQLRVAAEVEAAPAATSIISIEGSQRTTQARAWQKQADVEISLAGSSMQLPVLELAAKSLFAPGSAEVLLDDGGTPGRERGHMFRAFYGVASGTGVSGLDGKRLLIHFSAVGGSYAGVAKVARAEKLQRMQIGPACTDNDQNQRWSCPITNVEIVADAGLADVKASLHVGANLPAGAGALGTAELARLDSGRTYAMALAPVANRTLQHAGLGNVSKTQLAAILTGHARTSVSDVVPSLPSRPLTVCRLPDGAQAAVNSLVLGTACGGTAPQPVGASANVIEQGSAGDVIECLERADRIGAFAVAVLSTQHRAGERWGYLSLDGVPATKQNLTSGRYPLFAEAWMFWRNTAVNGAQAPSGDTLATLRLLRSRLADVAVLEPADGALALAGGAAHPARMTVSTGGDACAQAR